MDWLLVVPGALAAGYAGWTAWWGWRASHWPVAPGYIGDLESRKVRVKGRPDRRLYASYRYSVGGQAFYGRQMGFGADGRVPPPGVRPGEPVRVYYDPKNPARAVLRAGVRAADAVVGLVGVALIVSGMLLGRG